MKSVTPGGVAAQEGSLAVGDRLLQVQHHPLVSASYDKVGEILHLDNARVNLEI